MALENNIPAFPRPMSDNLDMANSSYTDLKSAYEQDGMTLLDYFAAKAMAADVSTISNGLNDVDDNFHVCQYEGIATRAYVMAGFMLEARKKYIK